MASAYSAIMKLFKLSLRSALKAVCQTKIGHQLHTGYTVADIKQRKENLSS